MTPLQALSTHREGQTIQGGIGLSPVHSLTDTL